MPHLAWSPPSPSLHPCPLLHPPPFKLSSFSSKPWLRLSSLAFSLSSCFVIPSFNFPSVPYLSLPPLPLSPFLPLFSLPSLSLPSLPFPPFHLPPFSIQLQRFSPSSLPSLFPSLLPFLLSYLLIFISIYFSFFQFKHLSSSLFSPFLFSLTFSSSLLYFLIPLFPVSSPSFFFLFSLVFFFFIHGEDKRAFPSIYPLISCFSFHCHLLLIQKGNTKTKTWKKKKLATHKKYTNK